MRPLVFPIKTILAYLCAFALFSVAAPGFAHECNPERLLKSTLRLEKATRLGLHQSEDSDFTIRRVEKRGKFSYNDEDGEPVTNRRTLKRIEELKIRIDLKDVKICADPRGHIQAIGLDAKSKPQYTYHPLWLDVRKSVKFESTLPAFGEALPAIRAAVTKDLRGSELSEKRLNAAIVRLLDETLIRIGSPEYARKNGSFGLTTLRKSHVELDGNEIIFSFPGKSGVFHRHEFESAPIARLILDLLKVPGWSLFKFANEDGEFETIDADNVNAYLKEITQSDFTAKDFRTWGGTVAAAEYLNSIPYPATEAEMSKALTAAAHATAEELENTPAISRVSYIHPKIFELYNAQPEAFAAAFKKAARRSGTGRSLIEEAVMIILSGN